VPRTVHSCTSRFQAKILLLQVPSGGRDGSFSRAAATEAPEKEVETMDVFRRNKKYWVDFSLNGQRFRQSLDTTDWREANRLAGEIISQAQAGKLSAAGQSFARLAFTAAADRYLNSRKLELSDRSLKKERQLLVQPSRFFQATPLTRITTEILLAYRESRAKSGTGPAYVNMEMGAIRRILKRAKRWHVVAEDIRPLKERRDIGRAMAHEEKVRLLRLAATRPEWQVARCAAILALNTTMRDCELKGLRWRDVNLLDRMLTVQRSKTEAGERVIPLNRDAMAAILELYKRAQSVGATDLSHYVFPTCENDKIDPTRPQTTWRTAWRKLTRVVQCPACALLQNPGEKCCNEKCRADIHELKSPLAGLRFHDLRHHAITELAESQASDQTVMAIAGHVSQKMLAHYSHVRLDAKRHALDALSDGGSARGYGTKHDTNALPAQKPGPQVVEENGRPVRARTADLHRVKVAL
jgi:integrase